MLHAAAFWGQAVGNMNEKAVETAVFFVIGIAALELFTTLFMRMGNGGCRLAMLKSAKAMRLPMLVIIAQDRGVACRTKSSRKSDRIGGAFLSRFRGLGD